MQLADLALGRRHQPHARERQLLEQGRDMLLVAAEPVQPLGQHYLEAAGTDILEQPLVARPQGRSTAQRMVGVDLADGPAVAQGQLAAQPHLVLDRGRPLRVRAVAGVDHRAHHRLRGFATNPSRTS